jgi:transposase
MRLKKTYRIDLSTDVEPLVCLSEATRNFIQKLDKSLKTVAKDNPVCRRFLEIPGVGPICALSFYASIGDPNRFNRNADVGPYLGMVPVLRQSGQSTARLRISKRGDAMTRTYLAQAAMTHLRVGSTALAAWGSRLKDRAGANRAQIAVGRKLAVIMIGMWKTGASYDPMRGLPPNPDSETAFAHDLLAERQA